MMPLGRERGRRHAEPDDDPRAPLGEDGLAYPILRDAVAAGRRGRRGGADDEGEHYEDTGHAGAKRQPEGALHGHGCLIEAARTAPRERRRPRWERPARR